MLTRSCNVNCLISGQCLFYGLVQITGSLWLCGMPSVNITHQFPYLTCTERFPERGLMSFRRYAEASCEFRRGYYRSSMAADVINITDLPMGVTLAQV